MYPIAHMAAAVGGVGLGERLLNRIPGVAPLATAIDYRCVAAGALIPDAIDKPLARAGIAALAYDQTAGHTIGHTLLFALCLIWAGTLVARRGEPRLLWLGVGSLTHLLVDPVIAYPSVLGWPLFGMDFPESKGIPSWPYLIGFDLMLVAAGVLVSLSPVWRERILRFALNGQLVCDVRAEENVPAADPRRVAAEDA